MAESKAGKAKVKSAARMTSSSTQPRRAAASKPKETPKARPMPTAITPTKIEFWLPTNNCEAMSRPRLSVPNQCAALGAASLLGMSISATGQGDHTRDSKALHSNSATNTAPHTMLGWRRA